jgi:3-oxoadipate enol-lactonase
MPNSFVRVGFVRAPFIPIATRRLGRLAGWSVAIFLAACAGTGNGIGAASPERSLGQPHMVPTSLGRLAVWDTGPQSNGAQLEGPAVLLWPSIFSDHVIFRSLVEHWRGKRRVILIDGPGHGASEGPRDRTFTMQACAVAMNEVMDSRSVASAVVGGTSWGGLVGGEFAILYPQRTQGVLMMNTPFFVSTEGASTSEKFITWGARTLAGTSLFTNGVARSFFMPATRAAGGPILEHFHDSLHRADAKALSNAIRSVLIERSDMADRLPRIAAPALVIAGRHDDMYPLERQREAVQKLPLGKLEVVESRHISVVDRPADVARLIDTFLAGLAAARESMSRQ